MEPEVSFPAVYTDRPAPGVSPLYQFIPTTEIIDLMAAYGFTAREMKQMNSRVKDKKFAKHAVRFRHKNAVELYGAVPEILVTTAHDTSASFHMRGGLYRLLCLNGLVCGHDLYKISLKHMGDAKTVIEEAIRKMAEETFPTIKTQVEHWARIKLHPHEKLRLARDAMELRYPEEKPHAPDQLLAYRRLDDRMDDLWTVFNVIQENVIGGGMPYGSRMTRPIAAIDKSILINAGLWDAAEKLAWEIDNA